MAQQGNAGRRAIGRRDFLKLCGGGFAGAVLFASAGTGLLARPSLAQQEEDPGTALEAEFEEAAKKYEVPKELLLAMGYVNTRLKMPPPQASDYEEGDPHGRGAYGIMQLVRNPSSDTLGDAARLTGFSEEDLKTDRRANIMGGAALLAASQGASKPTKLGGWRGAVNGKGGNGKTYRAVSGVGSGELFASQVLEELEEGIEAKTGEGERVRQPPVDPETAVSTRGEVTR